MNNWKCAITLATCCCIVLTAAPSASADFVGIKTVIKDDPDTDFLCTQGNGGSVPGPLTVCNVFAVFDDPSDRLLIPHADLQVFNGANDGVFFQHGFGGETTSGCILLTVFPDLICDSYVTIGHKCNGPDEPAGQDTTAVGPDWDSDCFATGGCVVGLWVSSPLADQGVAGTWPNLQILILQSSVAQGSRLSGVIDKLFWQDEATGDKIAEVDLPVECAASCGSCPTDTDGDGDTDAADLAELLGGWGPCGPGEPCACLDNDASGSIDAFDLGVLLGAWGPCL